MSAPMQGHTYTVADVWDAFEAGAKEARANGGAPSDDLIRKAADAYCKLVHPHAAQPQRPGWRIYAEGGGWYAWGPKGERVDLYPIPQGGTWRDVPDAPNGGFSAAVEQFERLIGPYYPATPPEPAQYPPQTREDG